MPKFFGLVVLWCFLGKLVFPVVILWCVCGEMRGEDGQETTCIVVEAGAPRLSS
jgi:hypothetical protein